METFDMMKFLCYFWSQLWASETQIRIHFFFFSRRRYDPRWLPNFSTTGKKEKKSILFSHNQNIKSTSTQNLKQKYKKKKNNKQIKIKVKKNIRKRAKLLKAKVPTINLKLP